MEDLVTMSCPSCGEKLQILPGTHSLACQHCGQEYLVRQDANDVILLEAFARCPKCAKNDKVEKVSAIVARETHEIRGTSIESETYTDKDGKTRYRSYSVPYSGTQMSVLAQRLSPPEKPEMGFNWRGCIGVVLVLCGVLSLAVSGCQVGFGLLTVPISEGASSGELFNFSSILGILLLPGAILYILLGAFLIKSSANSRKKRSTKLREVDIPQWEYAMRRWNQLYYCARDDILFIPGENKAVPVTQMNEYIHL